MKVLVICDDLWHPAEIIEKGFALIQNVGMEFDIIKTAKDILTPQNIREYPVIINCKGNCINCGNTCEWFEEGVTEVMPSDLAEYVKSGGGFLSLHAGNAFAQDDKSGYCELVGNNFVTHPPRNEVTVTLLKNEITDGVSDFTIHDEHYELNVTANDIEVFCETWSDTGGKHIGGYTRVMEKGRICVLTPGHNLSVWQNESFRRLLVNAIKWCGKRI